MQPFLSHNDLRVEEKNRSRAHFPPVHEQPNLGKRVSVNLCHIAGLRIPIVPLIESFYFQKAAKSAENIPYPAPRTETSVFKCVHPANKCTHTGPLAHARHTSRYREIRNGSRLACDHTCTGSLGAFNIVWSKSHLFSVDGAKYDVMLVAKAFSTV